jgi:hypothetical protein
MLLEEKRGQVTVLLVIFDEEYGAFHKGLRKGVRGKCNVKRLPSDHTLSTATTPPISSANF